MGLLQRDIKPALSVRSGDIVTIETLSQHATDDCERMVSGDPGAESVFHWTREKKNVDRPVALAQPRLWRRVWRTYLHGPGVCA
ncbi:hypothetical protein ULF88_00665 [Halopseudomonas pachastrellae]|nr:hypothetical protein [Halopseudomonas pachastrellae]